MRLDDDIELIDGLPVAYIRSLKAIVISDPHLGYEAAQADRGIFLPKVNLKSITEALSKALAATGAKTVIVNGDIKNDFSTVAADEFNELYDLAAFLKVKGASLAIVKGNHDNFVDRYRESMGLKIYAEQMAAGGYLLFHGDALPDAVPEGTHTLIMGHEHPAIAVYNSVGKKEKLRCFLTGSYLGARIIVFPAIGYFSTGTEMNVVPEDELLSPVLKRLDMGSMKAIAIGYGATMEFGTIAELRRAASLHM